MNESKELQIFSRWMKKGNLTAPLPRPPDAIKKGKEESPFP